jgi:tetratricopeptide (TPR) repeat protein
MVGGSGLLTALADRNEAPTRVLSHIIVLAAALAGTASCVYFNSYYNASKLFDQGRQDVEHGSQPTGRATLAASIEKAEAIVAANPDSRWADDAVRIIVRARLLREEWEEAVEMSRRLLGYALTRADTAEVAGYLGIARLHLGDPVAADTLLSFSLTVEEDTGRRSLLLYNRALAQARLGHFPQADADLELVSRLRPDWVQPRIERVGLLVDAGYDAAAATVLAAIMTRNLTAAEEQAVVGMVMRLAAKSPGTALLGLDGVESSALSREGRATLVKFRGDLHEARGEAEQALADYGAAWRTAPRTATAVEAQVAAARLALARSTIADEMAPIREMLERLMWQRAGQLPEVMSLWETVVRMEFWVDMGGLAYFPAAEVARDELRAPRLARTLFLRYAEEEPESVWAPKALLAALELGDLDSAPPAGVLDPGPEELRRRLWEDYRASPYVQAVLGGRGSNGQTYEELELDLRRQLDRLETLADEEVMARRAAVAR